MKRFLAESLLLILLIIATFLWEKSPLETYTVPLLGGLVLVSLLYRVTHIKKFKKLPIFLLTIMSILLILSTGGFESSLFYLIYFLSFILAFTLLPEITFIFNLTLFLAFLPQALHGDTIANLTKLSSLLVLSPLAYFFGREIRARDHREQQTKEAAEKIQNDVSEVVKSEGLSLKEKNVEKLADIIQESKKLEKQNKL